MMQGEPNGSICTTDGNATAYPADLAVYAALRRIRVRAAQHRSSVPSAALMAR